MSSNSCMSVCVILILLYVVYSLCLKPFKECFSEQATIATVAQKLNVKDVTKLYEVQKEMNPLCPIGMKAGLNGDCYSTILPVQSKYVNMYTRSTFCTKFYRTNHWYMWSIDKNVQWYVLSTLSCGIHFKHLRQQRILCTV